MWVITREATVDTAVSPKHHTWGAQRGDMTARADRLAEVINTRELIHEEVRPRRELRDRDVDPITDRLEGRLVDKDL